MFSTFINVRSHGLAEQYQPAGRREDVLCLEWDGMELLARRILVPNAMLSCKSVNTFL